MQIKEGADVYTTDDSKVGVVSHVVLKPATMEVTHLIVRKGFLFTEAKVVPENLAAQTTADRINLRVAEDELDDFPEYRESQYLPAEEGDATSTTSLFWYPTFGSWSAGRYLPDDASLHYVKKTVTNIPADTVALAEGADVISSDDEKVGELEEIYTEPLQDRATHLIVVSGLFQKQRKLIPTEWISVVSEDTVHLAVSASFVKQLPEYELKPQ